MAVGGASPHSAAAQGYTVNTGTNFGVLGGGLAGAPRSPMSTVMTGPMGSFSGVSCPTTKVCFAVGHGVGVLVERWDGKKWVIQPLGHAAANKTGDLTSVSCTSATACIAVGYYTGQRWGNLPLAERWNGKAWKIQSMPIPAGSKYTVPRDVSCSSERACTAVGYYYTSTDTMPLAERWNGNIWSIQPTPNSNGTPPRSFFGVSCPSATMCVAVGGYAGSGSHAVPLAEWWNGKAWKIQATPTPAGANDTSLVDVSCASRSSCTAVGKFLVYQKGWQGLVERWNGKSWTIQVAPEIGPLYGVSCTSVKACTIMGLYSAIQWSGSKWTLRSVTHGIAEMHDISCTSSNGCTGVGNQDRIGARSGDPAVTLASRWNGRKWTTQHTPNPIGQWTYD
jgi:hypothetical protein